MQICERMFANACLLSDSDNMLFLILQQKRDVTTGFPVNPDGMRGWRRVIPYSTVGCMRL